MNARERNALRWALVDVNNDLEGLKKQWGKIRPDQIQAVQDQVHKVIMKIVNADKRNTGIETPDDATR